MPPPSFRERYCASHGVPHDQFEQHLLLRTLYPHARFLLPLLRLIPDYFSADTEFLRSIGALRRRRDFVSEAGEYIASWQNRGVLRRWFLLRVSAERTRKLVDAHWESVPSVMVTSERH